MTAKADKDTTIAGTRLEVPCRAFRLFISLRFFIRCFGHLRSSRVRPVARFFLAADQQNKKRTVAWTIQRRLSRDCPPKVGLDHGLIWLIIIYS